MASTYNLEPPPTAKVVLRTTDGELALELFAKECPLASRNFLQLCLDGYYNDTSFHRIIPNFIIQGGDPSGTGSGGRSSLENGKPFEDEFNSRLRFNRRGLLGMANTGPNDNGSQFFLTLGKAEELTGKNTMFGRVEEGSKTIYNLMKWGEAELTEEEGSDRPMYPTKVTGAEILVNPFKDMVKREIKQQTSTTAAPAKKKPKKKAGKQMLSFADGDDDEQSTAPVRLAKGNPLFQNTIPEPVAKPTKRPAESSEPAERSIKRRASPAAPPQTISKPKLQAALPNRDAQKDDDEESSSEEDTDTKRRTSKLSRADAEIAALRSHLRRDEASSDRPADTQKKTALEYFIPETATRGRKKRGNGAHAGAPSREEQAGVNAFTAFRDRLAAANAINQSTKLNGHPNGNGKSSSLNGPDSATAETTSRTDNASIPAAPDAEADLCDLHFVPNCESCRAFDEAELAEDDDDADDRGWMNHKLNFEKDRKGKDLEWKRQNAELETVEGFFRGGRAAERERDRRREEGGAGEYRRHEGRREQYDRDNKDDGRDKRKHKGKMHA